MIERSFVSQQFKEYMIQEFISENLKKVGHSHTKMIRTPLGEKIVIYTSRPGLIVGRKGQNIKKLTKTLKKRFNLEDPQIEISEVENIHLDPQIVAEKIANSLERYGTARFKGIGHKVISEVMNAGAAGIEIVISGKIPSARAKRWRFNYGYLKKCGNIAKEGVRKAYSEAQLKSGTVGVQVRIMPSDLVLPDRIKIHEDVQFDDLSLPEIVPTAKIEKKPKKKAFVKRREDGRNDRKDDFQNQRASRKPRKKRESRDDSK